MQLSLANRNKFSAINVKLKVSTANPGQTTEDGLRP